MERTERMNRLLTAQKDPGFVTIDKIIGSFSPRNISSVQEQIAVAIEKLPTIGAVILTGAAGQKVPFQLVAAETAWRFLRPNRGFTKWLNSLLINNIDLYSMISNSNQYGHSVLNYIQMSPEEIEQAKGKASSKGLGLRKATVYDLALMKIKKLMLTFNLETVQESLPAVMATLPDIAGRVSVVELDNINTIEGIDTIDSINPLMKLSDFNSNKSESISNTSNTSSTEHVVNIAEIPVQTTDSDNSSNSTESSISDTDIPFAQNNLNLSNKYQSVIDLFTNLDSIEENITTLKADVTDIKFLLTLVSTNLKEIVHRVLNLETQTNESKAVSVNLENNSRGEESNTNSTTVAVQTVKLDEGYEAIKDLAVSVEGFAKHFGLVEALSQRFYPTKSGIGLSPANKSMELPLDNFRNIGMYCTHLMKINNLKITTTLGDARHPRVNAYPGYIVRKALEEVGFVFECV